MIEIHHKRRLVLVVAALLVLAGFFVFQNFSLKDGILISNKTLPWGVFEKYLNAAKKGDLENIAKYTYQLSSVCSTTPISDECRERMQTAYTIGSQFKKKDFTISLEDSMQVILATEPKLYENDNEIGYEQQYLVFARKSDGSLSVAGIDPRRTWYANKNGASTTEELLVLVDEERLDTDKDGAPDKFERCEFPETLFVISCESTDPLNRDSDGDGWWDGVEPFLLPR